MAEKLTDEAIEHGSNSEPLKGAERAEAIKKLHAEMIPIEARQANLAEERRQLRHTFKAATGIALADFDAERRICMIEDDDERKGKMADRLAVYEALRPGEQSELFAE